MSVCVKIWRQISKSPEDLEANVTHDINGVFNISDDIIAHATNQNEH